MTTTELAGEISARSDGTTGGPLARLGRRRAMGLLVCVALCIVVVAASLALGTRDVALGDVMAALFSFDGSSDQMVVRQLRVPRTLLGLLVGSALGVAGALMQAITRNPLADPGLLGVSAGSSLAVVVGIAFFGMTSASQYIWLAFVGAAVVSVVVYILGSMGRTGATPVRLTLAGAALASLLASLTTAVVLTDPATLDRHRFWVVGSLADRPMDVVIDVLPFVALGLAIAIALAGPLNAIALGDDTARSLGVRVARARLGSAAGVMLLCGAATAACGPIVFVGLVIPQVARRVCGPDHRWLIPYSAAMGAVFLLGCDVVSRVVARPSEIQVGITTAVIGGIGFVILVRRTRLAQL